MFSASVEQDLWIVRKVDLQTVAGQVNALPEFSDVRVTAGSNSVSIRFTWAHPEEEVQVVIQKSNTQSIVVKYTHSNIRIVQGVWHEH